MKHIVITGANRGIGLEMVKQLLAQGHQVTAICRQASKELIALGINTITDIDMTSELAIRSLAHKIKQPIDILVNNAGMWHNEKMGALNADNIANVMFVNAVAPLVVTETLVSKLTEQAIVVMITSRMGSIADNSSGGRYAYRMSKAALNAASKSLAIDLKNQGIRIVLIHPGHVATDMGGSKGIPVDEAVGNILSRIAEADLKNSGVFYHANGDILPW